MKEVVFKKKNGRLVSEPIAEGAKVYFYTIGYDEIVRLYYLEELQIDYEYSPPYITAHKFFNESPAYLAKTVEILRKVKVNADLEAIKP